MAIGMVQLKKLKSWGILEKHAEERHLSGGLNFKLKAQNIELDISYQRIGLKTIDLLLDLASEGDVKKKIAAGKR